jgi:hypothetical protein
MCLDSSGSSWWDSVICLNYGTAWVRNSHCFLTITTKSEILCMFVHGQVFERSLIL